MRILLAHNHRLLRDGVRPLLSKLSPRALVLEAASFGHAVAIAEQAGGADLIVFGDDLPGIDGINGIMTMHQLFPMARLVMMTERNNPESIMSAFSLGVAGVVFKSLSGSGMLGALRLVLSGEFYLPAEMITALADMVANMTKAKPQLAHLSPAESEVVPLLINGKCNKAIANSLGIQEAAVKGRLRTIYRKIGVGNRAQAVLALVAIALPNPADYLSTASPNL